MANENKWKAPNPRTTGISADTIAADSNEIGLEIDNETNLDRHLALELTWTCSTASTEDEVMEVRILYDLAGGGSYEDGSDSVDSKKSPVGFFIDNGLTSAQKQTIRRIPISPFKFKVLLTSKLTNSATSVTLIAETYNEDIQ